MNTRRLKLYQYLRRNFYNENGSKLLFGNRYKLVARSREKNIFHFVLKVKSDKVILYKIAESVVDDSGLNAHKSVKNFLKKEVLFIDSHQKKENILNSIKAFSTELKWE